MFQREGIVCRFFGFDNMGNEFCNDLDKPDQNKHVGHVKASVEQR